MYSLLILAAFFILAMQSNEKPFKRGELIFPPESLHNHGSCIVECLNGDLLASWYRGSGERRADDVAIMGARLRRNARQWSPPFLMADTPGFPDCNSCMIIDPQKRLWLFWPTILDNRWESALLKYRVSRDYMRPPRPPRWEVEKVLHIKPGPEFVETVRRDLTKQWEPYRQRAAPEQREELDAYLAERQKMAETPLSVRLGWMPRPRPVMVGPKRLLLPLYSDGFDFSLMVMTDDGGETWQVSAPLVGPGNVQPTVAQRKDGTLVAYFRDNGPPPQRVMVSESKDNGMTWSLARDTDLPDPGAGLEVLVLKSGRWLLIHNNTEQGRHQLSISISEDEGRTWPFVVDLERDTPGPDAGSYSYPSILQARDGTIHASYSYTPNRENAAREGKGESIKHVQFNEAWLMQQKRAR